MPNDIMDGLLHVDYDLLTNAWHQLKQHLEAITQIESDLRVAAQSIAAEEEALWVGRGAQAFGQGFTNIDQQLATTGRAELAGSVDAIPTIINAIQIGDQEASKGFYN